MKPNVRMADLPSNVTFAKWADYQHPNATHWIKVHFSILYDERTKGSDGARGRLQTGMLIACGGHGKVNVESWIEQCTDKRSARNDIKRWVDNGLLIAVPGYIDREIEREGEAIGAPAAHPPITKHLPEAPAVPKPARRRKAANGEQAGNWIAPVLEEWRERHGALPDGKTRGLLLKGLQDVYAGGQTPEQMGERFGIWLAIKPPEKHRYVEDFTSRYGDYDPEKCRISEYVLSLTP